MKKKGTQKGLGEEWNTFERFERSPEELTKKFFKKLYKTSELTVEQKEWVMVLYKLFWPSTTKDENDAISPIGVR